MYSQTINNVVLTYKIFEYNFILSKHIYIIPPLNSDRLIGW